MRLSRGMIKIFKIKNRKGYAAMYAGNLTEGRTRDQAFDRMVKAVCRKRRRPCS